MHACVRACFRVSMCSCVCARVLACVHARVCVYVCCIQASEESKILSGLGDIGDLLKEFHVNLSEDL